MKVNFKTKNSSEIFILVMIIGLLDLLSQKAISIDTIERHLFSPYSKRILSDNQVDEKVIELVALGCELEDIESLLPHLLDSKIAKLKESANELLWLKKAERNAAHWLQK